MATPAPAPSLRRAFFLRAVNVSGTNLVRMADLRADLEAVGFGGVESLLASGNLIATPPGAPEPGRRLVEEVLARRLGRRAAVVMFSQMELERLLSAVPDGPPPGAKHFVGLTGEEPSSEGWQRLLAVDGRGDTVTALPRGVLLACFAGQAETVYTTDKLERTLGVPVTARNLNTLNKVLAKLGQGQAAPT